MEDQCNEVPVRALSLLLGNKYRFSLLKPDEVFFTCFTLLN